MNTSTKLLIAFIVVVACIGGSWLAFSQPPSVPPQVPETEIASTSTDVRVNHSPEIPNAATHMVAADGSISANASALKYQMPKERSLDMQLFDKALLYLMDVQDADGHFDSKKTGAAPEFQTLSNDIILTSVGAWVLMGSSVGVNQNPEAVARARKAIQWLESKLKPDGTIGDGDGPGETAAAQFFASDAFRLAVSYSTRESLRVETGHLNSVALRRMMAKNGGYGPSAKSDEPTADMLALASFVFKFAGYDGFKFDAISPADKTVDEKTKNSKGAFPIEEEILDHLRAGFKRLDSKQDPAGAIFAEKAGGPSDWRSTVCGMQGIFMINPSRKTVTPALEFVFGPFDKKTESYPRVLEHVSWGKSGEGYDAIALWQGSIAVVYMFTEDKYESKTWIGNLRTMLKEHQSPDGSWAVAGEDAKRGRVWRTALHAMTLALTTPPPPPPAPPPDDATTNTPAVPAK